MAKNVRAEDPAVSTLPATHLLLVCALGALLGCESSTTPGTDSGTDEVDAFTPVEDDAGGMEEIDASSGCPTLQAGRWVIGDFTYDGADCTADWTIDLEYHPVAFTVGSDGLVSGCECDTMGDACSVERSVISPPDCSLLIACRGNSLRVTATSATTARVEMHQLAARSGICFGSGPFTPE